MSLTTIDIITKHILEDKFYDDVLLTYLKNKEERNEFRQELWLILLEMPRHKLIGYYDTKCLKYIYIGIINNQIKSNTSPWHRKFRNEKQGKLFTEYNETKDLREDDINSTKEIKKKDEIKIKYIEDKLNELELKDPYLKRDITIFKMHFYDKMSYRKIAKKTNISLVSIWKYVNNVLFLLRKDKNENENDY